MTQSLKPAGYAGLAFALGVLAACSSGGSRMGGTTVMPPGNVPLSVDSRSDLANLNTTTTIGSTIDPVTQQDNPYGLDIAPISAGKLTAGDLVVCNFNNSAGIEGQGTSIVALHPTAGSTPLHITANNDLLGCDALALAPNDNIWSADFSANNNPITSPAGVELTTLSNGPWHNPFGEAFAPATSRNGNHAAFYVSNAGDGSIVRVNINPGASFTFDVIATGFAVNGGAPGSILGPSGLQYDRQQDRLYIVDGTNNTVSALEHVSTIPAGGVTVSGTSFGGASGKRGRLLFSGAPLNGPISSALFPDGHLAIGNTLDPDGQNLMVEITQRGKLLDVKNVDTGPQGAIFGMVAGSDGKLYFNDDNDNMVKVLTP